MGDKSETKKKSATKVIKSADGKTKTVKKAMDSSAAKPCKDTEGETDISIAGKPATCAQLAPYCKYAQFKKQVSKICPKSCGVCKDANPSSKSASAVKDKSETKKKSATKVIKSADGKTKTVKKAMDSSVAKPCKDTEGETDISIAGKPATCAQLAQYCRYLQFR